MAQHNQTEIPQDISSRRKLPWPVKLFGILCVISGVTIASALTLFIIEIPAFIPNLLAFIPSIGAHRANW